MNIGKIEQSLSGVKTQNNSFTQNTTPSINQGTIQSGKQQVVNMPTVFQEPKKSKGSQLADLLGVGVKGLEVGSEVIKDINDKEDIKQTKLYKKQNMYNVSKAEVETTNELNNFKLEVESKPLDEQDKMAKEYYAKRLDEIMKSDESEEVKKSRVNKLGDGFQSFSNNNFNQRIDIKKKEIEQTTQDSIRIKIKDEPNTSDKELMSIYNVNGDKSKPEQRLFVTSERLNNAIENLKNNENYDAEADLVKLKEQKPNKVSIYETDEIKLIIDKAEEEIKSLRADYLIEHKNIYVNEDIDLNQTLSLSKNQYEVNTTNAVNNGLISKDKGLKQIEKYNKSFDTNVNTKQVLPELRVALSDGKNMDYVLKNIENDDSIDKKQINEIKLSHKQDINNLLGDFDFKEGSIRDGITMEVLITKIKGSDEIANEVLNETFRLSNDFVNFQKQSKLYTHLDDNDKNQITPIIDEKVNEKFTVMRLLDPQTDDEYKEYLKLIKKDKYTKVAYNEAELESTNEDLTDLMEEYGIPKSQQFSLNERFRKINYHVQDSDKSASILINEINKDWTSYKSNSKYGILKDDMYIKNMRKSKIKKDGYFAIDVSQAFTDYGYQTSDGDNIHYDENTKIFSLYKNGETTTDVRISEVNLLKIIEDNYYNTKRVGHREYEKNTMTSLEKNIARGQRLKRYMTHK